MRRQMQLRPSQGGKMRGPVGEAPPEREASLAGSVISAWTRKRIDYTARRCCGYIVCACAPVEEPEPVEDGVHKSPAFRTPIEKPEVERPRIEVGMRVRVKDDALSCDGENESPWRGEDGTVLRVEAHGIYGTRVAVLDRYRAVHISGVEPIE